MYVGPIYGGNNTIGSDNLPVPSAFYKVVVDRHMNEVMGFVMPQEAIKKGPVAHWRVTMSDIQAKAKISLPLPTDVVEATETWPTDLKVWTKKHKAQCG